MSFAPVKREASEPETPATGSEEYTKAIGRLNWSGFLVIGIPLMGVTFGLLLWLLRSITRLTGLERDDLMNQGTTVRKQVNNG